MKCQGTHALVSARGKKPLMLKFLTLSVKQHIVSKSGNRQANSESSEQEKHQIISSHSGNSKLHYFKHGNGQGPGVLSKASVLQVFRCLTPIIFTGN